MEKKPERGSERHRDLPKGTQLIKDKPSTTEPIPHTEAPMGGFSKDKPGTSLTRCVALSKSFCSVALGNMNTQNFPSTGFS